MNSINIPSPPIKIGVTEIIVKEISGSNIKLIPLVIDDSKNVLKKLPKSTKKINSKETIN